MIIIKNIALHSTYYQAMRDLRNQVLLRPLGIPDHSWEMHDKKSWHFVALRNDTVIGCAVLVPSENDLNSAQLIQMAVDPDSQGKGIGKLLLKEIIAFTKTKKLQEIYCHSRAYATKFYEQLGFKKYNKPFIEVGIPHHLMKLKMKPIREVEGKDNPSLAYIIKNVFEEYKAPKEGTVYSDPSTNQLFEYFQHEKAILWVAENEGKVVGCCGIYPTKGLPEKCAELVKFYIAKEARGLGLGKELMKASMKSASNFGYESLYIESLPEFSNAVEWYKKLGFQQLEERLGNSGHSSCNIWMLKKLNK